MLLTVTLTLVGSLASAVVDVRSRRIPNVLTGAMAVTAIVVHAFGGWAALGISLAVMVGLTLTGTVLYSRGGIGGGDVKLAIAASALLSYPLFIPFLLYTAIGGGVLAIAFLAARGNARATISRAVLMTMSGAPGLPAGKAETMPYAVAFAFGAVMVALSQTVAPFLRITL